MVKDVKKNWQEKLQRVVLCDTAADGLSEREWTFALWPQGYILEVYQVRVRLHKREPFKPKVSYFRQFESNPGLSIKREQVPFDASVKAKLRECLMDVGAHIPIMVASKDFT